MNFLKKFGSRKFVATLISNLAGIIVLFVGNEKIVTIIAGALMIVIPSIIYCITEGKLDLASIKEAGKAIVNAVEEIRDLDDDEEADKADEADETEETEEDKKE